MPEWPEDPIEPPPPYTPGDAPPPVSRGRYRTDPRLTPRHRIVNHRGIPYDVLTVLSRYLASKAPVSLASLALTCKRIYQVVLPHLYRSITIDRNSLPKLMYGVQLPSPRSYLSFQPDGTLPPKVVSPDVLKRRTEAFRLVEEVIVEGFVPDVWYSESLAMLQPSERILFPNAKRLYISAEIIVGCIHWELVERGTAPGQTISHPILKALRRVLVPDQVGITSGIMEIAGLSDRLKWRGLNVIVDSGRKILERLFAGWQLNMLVFHGLTKEWLVCTDTCRTVVFHYVIPKYGGGFSDHSKAERIKRIRGVVMELKRLEATRLVVVGPGLGPSTSTKHRDPGSGAQRTSQGKEKQGDTSGAMDPDEQERWRRHISRQITLADPAALDTLGDVLERVDSYSASNAQRLSTKQKTSIGLGPRCKCYRLDITEDPSEQLERSHLVEVEQQDESTSNGVTRLVWRSERKH